jgi:hypothetical protein
MWHVWGQEKCTYAFGGKIPLGRPRHRQDYNIKIYLLEVGWGSMKWIGMVQDTDYWREFVNSVMKILVP